MYVMYACMYLVANGSKLFAAGSKLAAAGSRLAPGGLQAGCSRFSLYVMNSFSARVQHAVASGQRQECDQEILASVSSSLGIGNSVIMLSSLAQLLNICAHMKVQIEHTI